MSVKANILRDASGNIIIQMQGDLTFEHSTPLRNQITEVVESNPQAKVTVDLAGVDFVGSSGICHFIETITLINGTKPDYKKVRLANLSSDFQKVMRLFSEEEANLLYDAFEMSSDNVEDINLKFGNRKHTFEN